MSGIFFRYVKPCVPIISHRRPPESIEELGENVLAQWRPDSSMICVVVRMLSLFPDPVAVIDH